MNDKIKELAKNVGAYFDVILFGRHDGVLFTETELERFAELIIEECVRQIQNGIVRSGDTSENNRSYEHIEAIKQHFGVER